MKGHASGGNADKTGEKRVMQEIYKKRTSKQNHGKQRKRKNEIKQR